MEMIPSALNRPSKAKPRRILSSDGKPRVVQVTQRDRLYRRPLKQSFMMHKRSGKCPMNVGTIQSANEKGGRGFHRDRLGCWFDSRES